MDDGGCTFTPLRMVGYREAGARGAENGGQAHWHFPVAASAGWSVSDHPDQGTTKETRYATRSRKRIFQYLESEAKGEEKRFLKKECQP